MTKRDERIEKMSKLREDALVRLEEQLCAANALEATIIYAILTFFEELYRSKR